MDDTLQTLVDDARKILDAELCIVHLMLDDSLYFRAWSGELPEEYTVTREIPAEKSVCPIVIETEKPVVINDFATDEQWRDHSAHTEANLRFYAGIPLETSMGEVIGTICIFSVRPKDFEERDFVTLSAFSRAVMARLELLSALEGEQAARREEARRSLEMQRILDSSLDAICTIGSDGEIVNINPASVEVFGWESHEVIGKKLHGFVLPEDRSEAIAATMNLRQGQTARLITSRLIGRDGKVRWVEWSACPAPGSDMFYCFARNVTDRMLAEEKMRETEVRYQALIEHNPAIIYVHDVDDEGNTAPTGYISPRLEDILGFTVEEWNAVDDFWRMRLHPDDRERVFAEDIRTDETGDPFECEYRMMAKDGSYVWLRDEATLIRDEFGRPVYWLGIQYDITDRKQTERELTENEERYRLIAETASEAIVTIDGDSTILSVNRAVEDTFGYSKEQLIGRDLTMLMPERFRDAHSNAIARYLTTGKRNLDWDSIALPGLHESGREISLEVSFGEWVESGERRFTGFIRDITQRREAEEALRRAEKKYRSIFENTVEGIFQSTLEGRFLTANPAMARILGFDSPEELIENVSNIGRQLFVKYERRNELVECLNRDGFVVDFVSQARRKDGSLIWVSANARLRCDEKGEVMGYEGTLEDITERVRLEEASRESEERFRQLFDQSVDALFVHDEEGRIIHCNTGAYRSLGYTLTQLISMSIEDFSVIPSAGTENSVSPSRMHSALWENALSGEPGRIAGYYRGEHRRRDGSTFPVEVGVGAIDFDGRRLVFASARDITTQRSFEKRLSHLASHDPLTDLPNRLLFMDCLEESFFGGEDAERGYAALLYLDLDGFKDVNDRLGHGVGDGLLKAVSRRLGERLRPGDTVARLGGDEFTLLLADRTADETTALLRDLVAAVRQPLLLDGHELAVRISIGITSAQPGDDPDELLRRADVAMYAAKSTGGDRWTWFDPIMDNIAAADAQLSADLRQAIARDELFLLYQPIVELPHGGLAGVEALVRWRHPVHGLVSPGVFIPLAERNGYIVELGRWVLREVVRQTEEWEQTFGDRAPAKVSVNISARQLREPGFPAEVAELLHESGIDPHRLVAEVTETAVLGTGEALDAVRALHDLGLRVALDDFGTGQSSLSLLVETPVKILKVDKSFVDGVTSASPAAVIVDGLIGITGGLRIEAVAEGVETAEQAERLHGMGYQLAQGFHFARPLPAADVALLITPLVSPSRNLDKVH